MVYAIIQLQQGPGTLSLLYAIQNLNFGYRVSLPTLFQCGKWLARSRTLRARFCTSRAPVIFSLLQ